MIRFLLILFIPFQVFSQTSLDKAIKLFEEKKYSDAKIILIKIDEKDNKYDVAQYFLGRIAMIEQKFEDAADYYENAVEANGKVALYHSGLGDAYGGIAQSANPLRQGLLASKMKSEWERAIELDPKLIEPRQSLIQFYMRAPGFMGGSIDKAKEMAKQLLGLKPAVGHMQMGNIFIYEKKYADAEKEFIEMYKIDSTYRFAFGSFYISQQEWDKAFDLFEKEVKKNPNDYLSLYQIGKISALSGKKPERGEECLKKYLTYQPKQNEPSHAGAKMRLAQIQEKRGKKAEAKKLYEEALKQDASLREAKEGLERVSK